ncbi:Protein kinase-like domain protein [Raphanus sativus]|nr:Protein kinase-like domain protein [Raphanus sativus]
MITSLLSLAIKKPGQKDLAMTREVTLTANSGLLNEKRDIYSFGVLLLEAVTRRDPVDYGRPANEVARVRLLGAVSRTGFGRGTGTSRVRLGNDPDTCKVNQGRHGLRGRGLVRDGRRLRDVSVDFCVKKELFIKY